MTLYELTEEYQQLLAFAEDPDVDPQVLADTMEGLGGEIEDKADGYAKVMKQLEADAAALKNEIDRLTVRKRSIENNIDRLKDTLKMAMIMTNKTKFKTELFSFGIQKNPKKVVLDKDLSEIPTEWLIQQEPKVDKAAIKAALEAEDVTAQSVAHFEQDESLRIR
jgi:hypothetical protein